MSSQIVNTETTKNVPDAIGFEKAINVIGNGVAKFRVKLSDVFEGKPQIKSANIGSIRLANPLNKGLVPLTRELSGIDICNCVTYLINKTQDVKPFKPLGESKKSGQEDKDVAPKTSFDRKLAFIQNKAYQIQLLIDDHRNLYGNVLSPDSRNVLSATLQGINEILSLRQNSVVSQLNDPEIQKVFPQVKVFNNFFSSVSNFLNRYTNASEIPLAEVKKVMSYIDKIRAICVAIQGLNSLASVVQLANGFVGNKLTEDIQKLNKIVKPEKVLPLIKSIQQACINLQQICRMLISYIQTGQTIIATATMIVNVVQIIKNFLFALPIPGLFTTLGVNNLFSDVTNNKVQKLIENIIKRLGQINQILSIIVEVITYVVAQIDEVLRYIRIILANIENCDSIDKDIIEDLKKTVTELEKSRNTLQAFKDNYLEKKNAINTTYGDRKNKYTIKIIDEQITDRNISIKRRYGIALNSLNQIVVQSMPTFASDTSIIINEVKVLLVSGGFVNAQLSQLSARDLQTINEASNFLENPVMDIEDAINQISFSDIEDSDKFGLDSAENENSDQNNLGLNSFINSIKGGKKLRRKMRTMMAKKLSETSSQIKKVDPNSKAATTLQNQATIQQARSAQESSVENKKEIEDLTKRKEKLLKEKSVLLKLKVRQNRVKEIDQEIKQIDEKIQQLQK